MEKDTIDKLEPMRMRQNEKNLIILENNKVNQRECINFVAQNILIVNSFFFSVLSLLLSV